MHISIAYSSEERLLMHALCAARDLYLETQPNRTENIFRVVVIYRAFAMGFKGIAHVVTLNAVELVWLTRVCCHFPTVQWLCNVNTILK